jgi:hypothetical protein
MTEAFGIEEGLVGQLYIFMQEATLYLHKGSVSYGHNGKLT